MRSKWINPKSVFKGLDYEDYFVNYEKVDYLFPRLSQPIKLIIVARYMYGYSLSSIAKKCGVSKSTVCVAIDVMRGYDNIIRPVPIKEAI